MKEIWKDIEGFEGRYKVSNHGKVKSLARISDQGKPLEERILKEDVDRRGYAQVTLYKGAIKKRFKVHRLVAIHFIDNLLNLPQINHIDEDKNNNKSDNLEWCNQMYNNLYNGRHKRIGKKLEVPIVVYKDDVILKFDSGRKASNELNLIESCVYRCLRGELKTHKGYRFEYDDDGEVGSYVI